MVETVLRTELKEGHKKAGHDVNFKPAKTVLDRPYRAPYEHMVDRVEVKKNYRDGDGAVSLEPRNFYTTPAKLGKVGKKTTFTPQPAHMPDDFEWPQKVRLQEHLDGKKLEQEKPFSQKAKEVGLFSKNKEIYDVCIDIKPRPPKEEPKPPYMQEIAFKPSKPARSGASCTFE